MYKGKIEGWPTEIVEQMLKEQVAQGNKRDVTVFEEDQSTSACFGGFSWGRTVAKDNGWVEIVDACRNKKFTEALETFHKYYPLKPYPKVMNVWDYNPNETFKRVVFMEKNGKYLTWKYATTIESAENETDTESWNYASDIEDPIYLTAQDVSEGKGVGVKPELIKFKES